MTEADDLRQYLAHNIQEKFKGVEDFLRSIRSCTEKSSKVNNRIKSSIDRLHESKYLAILAITKSLEE